jgi:hypothetical protein
MGKPLRFRSVGKRPADFAIVHLNYRNYRGKFLIDYVVVWTYSKRGL